MLAVTSFQGDGGPLALREEIASRGERGPPFLSVVPQALPFTRAGYQSSTPGVAATERRQVNRPHLGSFLHQDEAETICRWCESGGGEPVAKHALSSNRRLPDALAVEHA